MKERQPGDGPIRRLKKKVIHYSRELGIKPSLALAVAHQESLFTPDAVSSKGAVGVMQIMPATGRDFGVSREMLFHPEVNIQVGLLYLREQLLRFQRLDLALAAYNAGPGRVQRAGFKVPKIKETQNYVQRVLALEKKYDRQYVASAPGGEQLKL
ncbi:MAG: lytic transglycosylase domain-containing protein [Desulfovermiculus sp.]